MKREWKPGDVAMYEYLSSGPLVALRVRGGNSRSGGDCPVDEHDGADHWHLSNGGWTRGTSDSIRRPLAVIDPEDREQVERLIRLQDKHFNDGIREVVNAVDLHDMQAALREYADPKPPKPEEPTGRYAVVVDDEGREWLRTGWDYGMDKPWQCEATHAHWQTVNAVRVLSEGVTE